MNKVVLSGRVASELELKKTPTDASVCSFRIAVNRRFKNADGNYDTDFISCVAWRGTADFICKYFSKGVPIEMVGNLQTRNYEKDGQTVYVTEVVVEEVNFVLSNSKTEEQSITNVQETRNFLQSQLHPQADDGFAPIEIDDDIPF